MKSVCLAILNYNGIAHLEHLLPSVPAAVATYGGPVAVVVLDNRSTADDEAWTRQHHPEFEFVTAPRNEYMFSYNWLAAQRKEELLILLNNDTKLTSEFIAKLVRHFGREDVFSVCAKSLDWEGKTVTCGPSRLIRKKGFYRWGFECGRQELAHTLFSSSGFMAVDRKKFLRTGGFNRLFFPMYCDDLELGFRAWQIGWRSIYDPEAVVYHRENGSSASNWVRRNHLKNSLLFEWSCLPTEAFRWGRAARTANLALRELAGGRSEWVSIWWKTWLQWRKVRSEHTGLLINEEAYQTLVKRLEAPVPLP